MIELHTACTNNIHTTLCKLLLVFGIHTRTYNILNRVCTIQQHTCSVRARIAALFVTSSVYYHCFLTPSAPPLCFSTASSSSLLCELNWLWITYVVLELGLCYRRRQKIGPEYGEFA